MVQLGGGALLLFRKTALLGAAMMLPVMSNIVMINLFFRIALGRDVHVGIYLCIDVGCAVAESPCAGGGVLDGSSRRTGQCAA